MPIVSDSISSRVLNAQRSAKILLLDPNQVLQAPYLRQHPLDEQLKNRIGVYLGTIPRQHQLSKIQRLQSRYHPQHYHFSSSAM